MEESYYSINEFCNKLKISHSTVYKKIKEGTIPAIKLGKCWKIPKSALPQLFYQKHSF